MTFVFIVALGVSVIGMLTLLALKNYELKSNRVLFVRARPIVGGLLYDLLYIVVRWIPRGVARVGAYFKLKITGFLNHGIRQSAIVLESKLEKALHHVREKSGKAREVGEPSQFLQEVTNHKKSLSKRKKRTIFE